MIAILQWTTLAVCCVATLARVPSALRGENRSLFWIFALMTLAILLSIDAPYLAVDQAPGRHEHRQSAAALRHFRRHLLPWSPDGPGLQRGRCPAAHHRPRRHRSSRCRLGCGGGGLPHDGYRRLLGGFGRRVSPRMLAMPPWWSITGPPGACTPRSSPRPCFRRCCGPCAADFRPLSGPAPALLAVGTVAICLSLLSPVIPPSLGFMRFVINYSAVLCLVLGLCMIWLAKTLAKRAPKKQLA